MNNIRVAYSGLISFIVGLFSIFTGLVFVLIVTRTLSAEEYGTWSLITNLIFYLVISETIIGFWSHRQVARGEEVGKTAFISSGIFSLGAIPFYLALSYIIGTQSNANVDFLIFGVIWLPIYFVSQTLGGINIGHRPQAVSYSFLIFEIVKIPTALAFVYFLELGVEGAIISITLAYLIRIIVQIKFARPKLKNKFDIQILKRWIRLSWIALYSTLTRVIVLLDVMIYPLITSSVLGVAYYSAALTIAALSGHSASIAQALSPKLLAKGNLEHIPKNLSLMMYFAVPLLGISILFAKPGLFALNPIYESVFIIAILLSFKIFLFYFNAVFRNILESLETVDLEQNPKFSQLIKSKLFAIPTGRYINSFLYLFIFSIVIFFLYSSGMEELELVTWWAILSLSFEIPFFIFLIIMLKKKVRILFESIRILKYIFATTIFGFFFYFTSDFIINYEISIFKLLPTLIVEFILCGIVYLVITYFIDKNTRILFKTVTNEFRLFRKSND